MADFKQQLDALKLPSWMDKGEPAKLLNAARSYWQQASEWLHWPLQQWDAESCPLALLNVLAYQRDIERFNGEPLSLYRKRVKYAFINAVDAGSTAGFIAIFERLGIGAVQLRERQPGYDWDVILVRINDEQLSTWNTLMMNLVRQYGRTCRRYTFDVMNTAAIPVHSGQFDHDATCYTARGEIRHGFITVAQPIKAPQFNVTTEHYSASL